MKFMPYRQGLRACVLYNKGAALSHSTAGKGIGRSLQREAARGHQKYHHTQ